MKRYIYQKALETEQKQYLSQNKRKRLFWSDYFDLLVLGGGILLFYVAYRLKISLDAFGILLLGFGAAVVLLRRKIKNWQRVKLDYLYSYEKLWEKNLNIWQNKSALDLEQEFRDILEKTEELMPDDKLANKEYELLVIGAKDVLSECLKKRQWGEKTLLIVPFLTHAEIKNIKKYACGKIVLAQWEDMFKLSLKTKQIDLKISETAPLEKWVFPSKYLLGFGLFMLLWAEISQYFYPYFFAGIFLLSLFLVSFQKKSRANELVFLKKKLKSAKIKHNA